jgi:hypothetical protein
MKHKKVIEIPPYYVDTLGLVCVHALDRFGRANIFTSWRPIVESPRDVPYGYKKLQECMYPNLGPQFGTPIWDPNLGPQFGTPIWDPNLGPQFGTPIWDPDLGPRFWAPIWDLNLGPPIWDPDLGPRFGTLIWDPDL